MLPKNGLAIINNSVDEPPLESSLSKVNRINDIPF